MRTVPGQRQSFHVAPRSVYDEVGTRIAALIERFGLHGLRSPIMGTYESLCSESLSYPLGSHSPGHSRINHDGVPIQFAATIGSSHRVLQFLSDVGRPGIIGSERLRANRRCIAVAAEYLHLNGALSSITHLLDELAPHTEIDLLADHGGAFWVGTAFTSQRGPFLRIYINSRWGKENEQWARLSRFAAHFGKSSQWEDIAVKLAHDLQPLGIAISLSGNDPPAGRIYLSAYGKRMPFHEELAGVYGGEGFMRQLQVFGKSVLGDDYIYPTQSAVCSFGFGDEPRLDFKLELCAHCIFTNDLEATVRLRSWFETASLDATDYWDMLDILSAGYLSDKANNLHCYTGLGLRREAPYATVYLKPRLIPS